VKHCGFCALCRRVGEEYQNELYIDGKRQIERKGGLWIPFPAPIPFINN
jgi:hypothetical protein